MQVIDRSARDAPARVLALLVAANGHIHADELVMLERLDAFGRLGVSQRALHRDWRSAAWTNSAATCANTRGCV